MSETELKLALPRAAVKRAVALIAGLPGARACDEQRLDAVYFDTPRDDLKRAGFVLRLRREQGKTVQTVKTANGHGSLTRGEWSDPVDGPAPDVRAGKSGRCLRRALGKNAKLAPRFTVRVQRTRIVLARDGGAVEAAVDRGHIDRIPAAKKSTAKKGAQRGKQPISEIELELKDGGAPATLYDLALRLAQELPVSFETRSKSDRGYALDAAKPPKAVRTPRLVLKRADTLGQALCTAGRCYLGQFEANIPAALTHDADAIHQMRVGLRRLRAVLGAAKEVLPPLQYDWIKQRLKTVLQRLGPARNWDVLRAKLEGAPDAAHRNTASHRALAATAARAQRQAYVAAAEVLTGRATTIAILEVHRWLERLATGEGMHAKALGEPVEKVAPKLLDRQFKRLRKRLGRVETLSPEARHELRIACKNMRYTAEAFGAFYPPKTVKRFLTVLKPMQEALGALNDLRGAHDLLGSERSGGQALAAGEVLGWLDRDAARVMKDARKAVTRLRHTRTFW